VIPLAAQPAEKSPLQVLGIEPIGLGSPMLSWHRHACGMDDASMPRASSQR
jgi:hypothetical protein